MAYSSDLVRRLFTFFVVVGVTYGFASSDDRFLKKYAMMKIYESCLGPEVLKEVRLEMKNACAKCAALSAERIPQPPPVGFSHLPPGVVVDPNNPTFTKLDSSDEQSQENNLPENSNFEQSTGGQASFDREKLQQAILGFRPQLQSYPGQQPIQNSFPGLSFMQSPNPAYRPNGYPGGSPYFQYQFGGASANPFGYPSGFPMNPYAQNQYYPQYQQGGFYQSPYFTGHRSSRQMDLQDRIDILTTRTSGKVRNLTCVMQELGYLDQNLEPNYEQISQRVSDLPVSSELKLDIKDGLEFCQKFSQCVPDVKKENSPLSKELIKPMFFFRCYKHKKLEACIMKDIRERFTSEEDIEAETDFRSIGRSSRSIKPKDLQDYDDLDDMSAFMYDFLYGAGNFEMDSFF